MNDLESTLAIDFGTTNSVVFVYKSGKPEAVPAGNYNQQGSTLFPSYVEYSKNGVSVGYAAKNNFGRNNRYVVAAVKRIIGLSYAEYEKLQDKSIFGCEVIKGQDGYPRFIIDDDGNTKTPVEVASEIFKVLKKAADDYTHRNYTKAYVTVPANFKDHQCRAIKEAAKLAGLEVLKLITEPTAAAMSWCFEHPNEIKPGEKLMVYDFGGGTFDVSILQCFGPKRFRIINTDGDPNLGGNDLDTALMNYMIEKVGEIRMTPKKMNRLRQECETAKIELTSKCAYHEKEGEFLIKNVKIFESIDFADICYDLDTIDLTPRDLNKAIDSLVNNTIGITCNVISRESLKPEDIKYFLLVGGSSHLHLIRQRLHQKFTQTKFPEIDPDEAVAKGAMSLLINDKTREYQIEEKISYSCGLQTSDDQVKKKMVTSYGFQISANEVVLLLKKGDSIPAFGDSVNYTDLQDYQEKIKIKIYRWDGEPKSQARKEKNKYYVPISECIEIGSFTFEIKKPNLKNEQYITIGFSLNTKGLLTVYYYDNRHMCSLSESITIEYGGH